MKEKQPSKRIHQLLIGFFKDTLSFKEQDELDAWIRSSEQNKAIFQEWVDKDQNGEPLPIEKTYRPVWILVAFVAGIFIGICGLWLAKTMNLM